MCGMSVLKRIQQEKEMFASYHNSVDSHGYRNAVSRWHPNSSKFERVNCKHFAEDAIREAEELRVKIRGRRILTSQAPCGECAA